jgi:hypothetical protein
MAVHVVAIKKYRVFLTDSEENITYHIILSFMYMKVMWLTISNMTIMNYVLSAIK